MGTGSKLYTYMIVVVSIDTETNLYMGCMCSVLEFLSREVEFTYKKRLLQSFCDLSPLGMIYGPGSLENGPSSDLFKPFC